MPDKIELRRGGRRPKSVAAKTRNNRPPEFFATQPHRKPEKTPKKALHSTQKTNKSARIGRLSTLSAIKYKRNKSDTNKIKAPNNADLPNNPLNV